MIDRFPLIYSRFPLWATNYINTNAKSAFYTRVRASGNILIGVLPPREDSKRERHAVNFRVLV